MAEKENVVIEPATEADLDELSEMLGELFAQEGDFPYPFPGVLGHEVGHVTARHTAQSSG